MFKDYTENAKLDFCLENDIEFWKEIPNYNGIYSVSTFGNVRNNQTGRILKPNLKRNGYLSVQLYKNNSFKEFLVHRLVLTTLEGPCPNFYECDHKDRVKTNNKLINLHWVSHADNNKNRDICRKVNQYDLEGNFIKSFDTISEATEELDITNHRSGLSSICGCCKGRNKTAFGYKWRYADED